MLPRTPQKRTEMSATGECLPIKALPQSGRARPASHNFRLIDIYKASEGCLPLSPPQPYRGAIMSHRQPCRCELDHTPLCGLETAGRTAELDRGGPGRADKTDGMIR